MRLPARVPAPEAAWALFSLRWFCRISPTWPCVTQPLGSGTWRVPWAQCSLLCPRACACSAPHVLLLSLLPRRGRHQDPVTHGEHDPLPPQGLRDDSHWAADSALSLFAWTPVVGPASPQAPTARWAACCLGSHGVPQPSCHPARRPEESLCARLAACRAQGRLLCSKCRYESAL